METIKKYVPITVVALLVVWAVFNIGAVGNLVMPKKAATA
jgi:hypothetical protein